MLNTCGTNNIFLFRQNLHVCITPTLCNASLCHLNYYVPFFLFLLSLYLLLLVVLLSARESLYGVFVRPDAAVSVVCFVIAIRLDSGNMFDNPKDIIADSAVVSVTANSFLFVCVSLMLPPPLYRLKH